MSYSQQMVDEEVPTVPCAGILIEAFAKAGVYLITGILTSICDQSLAQKGLVFFLSTFFSYQCSESQEGSQQHLPTQLLDGDLVPVFSTTHSVLEDSKSVLTYFSVVILV